MPQAPGLADCSPEPLLPHIVLRGAEASGLAQRLGAGAMQRWDWGAMP